MKVFKIILQYILTIILAIFIVALIVIHIISSTILNSAYVILKLEEQDYFSEIYNEAILAMENYIPQSGLEETVLEGIISKEKIKNDTEVIIGNMYDGIDAEIETEEIANKLRENIIASVGEDVVNENQESIEQLIDNICQAYKDALTHTEYEDTINTYYVKISSIIDITKKIISIAVLVDIILLLILNRKSIYGFIAPTGISLMTSGLIFIIVNKFVYNKIKINSITVFNDSISNLIRTLLNDILSRMMTYGTYLIIIGLVITICFALTNTVAKRDTEEI